MQAIPGALKSFWYIKAAHYTEAKSGAGENKDGFCGYKTI
jgi:hypothetical protein